MELVEVEPWIFKTINGLDETVIFRNDTNKLKMLISNHPYQAYEKIAWYETSNFHLGLLLACLILFLGMSLWWSVCLVRLFWRKWSSKPQVETIQFQLPQWLGWIVSTLNVIALIGLVLLFLDSNYYTVAFAMSPALVFFMILAGLAALLTVGMILCTIQFWRMRFWQRRQRFCYLLLTLAAIVFSLDLAFWHLLWLS